MPAGRTPDTYKTRIYQIRKALGLSQKDMAISLGVTSDTVSRYECGTRHVPEPTLRLAESLLKKAPKPRLALAQNPLKK